MYALPLYFVIRTPTCVSRFYMTYNLSEAGKHLIITVSELQMFILKPPPFKLHILAY